VELHDHVGGVYTAACVACRGAGRGLRRLALFNLRGRFLGFATALEALADLPEYVATDGCTFVLTTRVTEHRGIYQ
jgi:hypothetical protein